ncbi:MAG: metallophosphoesterase, partial [Anaerovoracaceae bacterium]
MKKKLALVLSVIMIVLTLLAPAASYAEPEEGTGGETGGSEVTEPETPETPPAAPEEPGSSSGESSGTKKPSSDSGTTSSGNKTTGSTENTQQTSGSTQTDGEPEEELESSIEKGTISIIFTHDMHSQMDSVKITENGKTREQGGFARMATIFSGISKNYRKDSFVLDGGDFSQGSIYQTIYTDYASELRMMGYLGYDVTTLGNHEFDFRSAGLSSMLENAVKKNKNDDFDLPQIAACNVDWDGTLADEQLAEDGKNLQKAFEDYGVKESYTVIKKNGIKIAVFGLIGKEADEFAPESGTLFKDQVASAKETVAEIKANEKDVKLIVCLSHS